MNDIIVDNEQYGKTQSIRPVYSTYDPMEKNVL